MATAGTLLRVSHKRRADAMDIPDDTGAQSVDVIIVNSAAPPIASASASSSSSSSLSAGSTERLFRSVPPLSDYHHRRRSSRSGFDTTPSAPKITDAGECPRCGRGKEIHTFGYWPVYRTMVRICTFALDTITICGATWIDAKPHAQCSCGANMTIEKHGDDFFYACKACHSIGFDTKDGSPPVLKENEV